LNLRALPRNYHLPVSCHDLESGFQKKSNQTSVVQFGDSGDWRDYSVSGADLEVLVSVLDGERAMVFNADRASNIEVV